MVKGSGTDFTLKVSVLTKLYPPGSILSTLKEVEGTVNSCAKKVSELAVGAMSTVALGLPPLKYILGDTIVNAEKSPLVSVVSLKVIGGDVGGNWVPPIKKLVVVLAADTGVSEFSKITLPVKEIDPACATLTVPRTTNATPAVAIDKFFRVLIKLIPDEGKRLQPPPALKR